MSCKIDRFRIYCVYLWVKVGESGAPGQAGALQLKDRLELMFFLGQYNHNLDEKGRLTIPARFRDTLVDEGAYIMQGFDTNLIVLTEATFDMISQRLNQASLTDATARLLRRLLFSTASRAEFDKAGRILIPQYLRVTAGIDSEAVVVGAGKYIEIWSTERWSGQLALLQDPEANASRFEPYSILFG